MSNCVGRNVPDFIEGYGAVKHYQGAFATQPIGQKLAPKIKASVPHQDKFLKSIDDAIDAVGLKNGMTISFHHHLRNGDNVVPMVLAAIARKGIKDLTLAPSSLPDQCEYLVQYLEDNTITAIETSGVRGAVGKHITAGKMPVPTIIRSHGGRARAVECGDLKIDVTFVGAPACDIYGNMNGIQGKSAFGAMGYAMVDTQYADKVVAITDNLSQSHIYPISIPQSVVDFIVEVDSIGDPQGIATSALRFTKDPKELLIARYAADVIEHSGVFREGYSLQLGGGGASLAVARFFREKMLANKITGSFGLGGIGGVFVDMLEEGLFKTAFDTQTFDLRAAESLAKNPNHIEISAAEYASPFTCSPFVNDLDVVVLGATEIDVNFNVNGITNSNGVMMGASGGQSDTAAGAKVTVVVAPLLRGRMPIIIDQVHTIVTPGETVDIIVTEQGIAVNPKRADLIKNLQGTQLPIMSIEALRDKAYKYSGTPAPAKVSDEIIGVVEYRDGTVIDVVRKPV